MCDQTYANLASHIVSFFDNKAQVRTGTDLHGLLLFSGMKYVCPPHHHHSLRLLLRHKILEYADGEPYRAGVHPSSFMARGFRLTPKGMTYTRIPAKVMAEPAPIRKEEKE